MKIIDLLNKIANGEEVPNKIKYNDYLYEYVHDDRDYVEPKKWTYLFYDVLVQEKGFDFYIKLNDEVEIIEEPQEHKIPGKLIPTSLRGIDNLDEKIEVAHVDTISAIDKINEILDYLEVNNDRKR